MSQKVVFADAPFGKPGSDVFGQVGWTTDKSTLQWAPTNPDGTVPQNPQTVLSVQENGSYSTRPLTDNGTFEVITLGAGVMIVTPRDNRPSYVIAAQVVK
jgi:hypothetical protein